MASGVRIPQEIVNASRMIQDRIAELNASASSDMLSNQDRERGHIDGLKDALAIILMASTAQIPAPAARAPEQNGAF